MIAMKKGDLKTTSYLIVRIFFLGRCGIFYFLENSSELFTSMSDSYREIVHKNTALPLLNQSDGLFLTVEMVTIGSDLIFIRILFLGNERVSLK